MLSVYVLSHLTKYKFSRQVFQFTVKEEMKGQLGIVEVKGDNVVKL